MDTYLRNVSEETKNEIIALYKNNISIRQIAEKYNLTRRSISNFLTERGIKTTIGNHHRQYFHDEDYFQIIDTEEKAYWLGFLYADGYIVSAENRYGQEKVGITLSNKDIEHLEKFKKAIKATNPITDVSKVNSALSRIILTSQKTVNDLIKLGCVKNKSLILTFPDDQKVPTELIRHFIRGYFDGDGSISSYTKGSYNDYSFNIVGTESMILDLFLKLGGKGSYFLDKRKENSWYLRIGGNQQLKEIYHFLYDDATIFLDRKHSKFKEIFN